MINILITSLGSNTSISVIKALGFSLDKKYRIIGTDTNDESYCAGASMVDKFYKIPSVVQDPLGYENELIKIIKNENINCVIPIHDLEINKCAELSLKYSDITFWAVNNFDLISVCSDKLKINLELDKIGVKVPKQFNSIDDVLEVDLPIIVKPRNGVSSVGISIIKTKEELIGIKENIQSDDLIQKFVSGKEYTVDCYNKYSDGTFLGGCVRERVETKAGISTKGIVIENEEIIDLCNKICDYLSYKGASNIQFIIDNEIPYFIEINPRFSGAGILSYNAGFNTPLYTVLESIGDDIISKNNIDISVGMKMTRYWQEVFV